MQKIQGLEDSPLVGTSCLQSLGSSPPALHALGTAGRKISLSSFTTPVQNQGRCFSSNFRQSYAGQACMCLTVNSISLKPQSSPHWAWALVVCPISLCVGVLPEAVLNYAGRQSGSSYKSAGNPCPSGVFPRVFVYLVKHGISCSIFMLFIFWSAVELVFFPLPYLLDEYWNSSPLYLYSVLLTCSL